MHKIPAKWKEPEVYVCTPLSVGDGRYQIKRIYEVCADDEGSLFNSKAKPPRIRK